MARHSGARSEPGISRFSGAQLRTIVRSCGPPRNDGVSITTPPCPSSSAAPRRSRSTAPCSRRRRWR
ncbi:hypothetical protein Bdiaspc4_38240 [Bradyrhizobium diazoefficiens]|nr:hypothetical protein Bdiaspc4_38240 [Bradyrhizobium diazoefficiens]